MALEKKAGRAEDEVLAEWIAEFGVLPNNTAKKLFDSNGILQGLYLQSGQMKAEFELRPEIVFIDGTFCVNAEHYLLYIIMAQNGNLKACLLLIDL